MNLGIGIVAFTFARDVFPPNPGIVFDLGLRSIFFDLFM